MIQMTANIKIIDIYRKSLLLIFFILSDKSG